MMVRFQLFPTTSYGKYETIDYPRFDFILTIPNFLLGMNIVLKEIWQNTFTTCLSVSYGEGVIQSDKDF